MSKNQVQKFDTETGIREQKYPKGKYDLWKPEGSDPTTALINLAQKTAAGRPAVYDNSEAGLEEFARKTAEFFETVQRHNDGISEDDPAWIPDIESWAAYLSISRKTLLMYSRRNDQWAEYIELVKTTIYAVKKSLAERFKIPPVCLIFDMKNNAGYVDSLHLDTDVIEDRHIENDPETIKKRYENATRPPLPDLSPYDELIT